MHRISRKWRPPLALVIGGGLAGVLLTPLIGIVYFRLWGNVLGWGEAAWLVFWIALVATAILGLLLWRLVLRPVYALTAHAKAIKAGQMDAPAPTHFGTPEFRDLGQSVIDMGATLNSRAASLRAYADHVTHELKSPLTSIQGAAELLQSEGLSSDDRTALCETVAAASQRMDALLNDLRRHALASQSAGVGTCLLLDSLPDDPPLKITCHGTTPVPLEPQDLRAILVQLAQNAAAHGATTLDIDWDGTRMLAQDNGQGIAQGDASRIFDPFFTTRRDAGGTGMGLSIVRSLLATRGGQIELQASAQGACFLITFD
ncbi:MAG: HAMP domain-containing sensor histidine kinase [Ascidiaceihabitans sp.]|nr:HAMP domain-containing sensor histidine kinase [Ascidiaceihabitans sp.]